MDEVAVLMKLLKLVLVAAFWPAVISGVYLMWRTWGAGDYLQWAVQEVQFMAMVQVSVAGMIVVKIQEAIGVQKAMEFKQLR